MTHACQDVTHSSPLAILDEIVALDAKSADMLAKTRGLTANGTEADDE